MRVPPTLVQWVLQRRGHGQAGSVVVQATHTRTHARTQQRRTSTDERTCGVGTQRDVERLQLPRPGRQQQLPGGLGRQAAAPRARERGKVSVVPHAAVERAQLWVGRVRHVTVVEHAPDLGGRVVRALGCGGGGGRGQKLSGCMLRGLRLHVVRREGTPHEADRHLRQRRHRPHGHHHHAARLPAMEALQRTAGLLASPWPR